MVSDQYLLVCEREGHKFGSRPTIGKPLGVNFEYFNNAIRLLSKVGLMLAYTLWSKVFPNETELLHNALNDTIYLCLQQKRWKFIAEVEDFVLGEQMRKNISEINYRIRIINTAIGLKFSGDDKACEKLLQSVDWSASYRDFKLAIAVLSEQFGEAVQLMKSIGRSGEIIEQTAYHTWPLFTRFREHPEFYEAYFAVYGEPFAEKVETKKGAVEAHAKSVDSNRQEAQAAKIIDVEPINTKVKAGTEKASHSQPKKKEKNQQTEVIYTLTTPRTKRKPRS